MEQFEVTRLLNLGESAKDHEKCAPRK